MQTIVSFAKNKVYIICGTGSATQLEIERIIPLTFSENCVMNGIVTNVPVFIETVKEAWTTYQLPKKGVRLCVDTNHIKSKKMNLPKASVSNRKDIVAREFVEDGGTYGDLATSYVDVSQGSTGETYFAFAAERSYIKELTTLFQQMEIKLSGIYCSRLGVLKLLRFYPKLNQGSSILIAMEDQFLTSVIIENGTFVSMSSARIFSQHETESFGTEVARNVSQLLQFQISSRTAHPASEIYLTGFGEQDLGYALEQIALLNITPIPLENSDAIQVKTEHLAAVFQHIGTLALNEKEENLLDASIKADESNQKTKKMALRALPIVGICIACLVAGILQMSINAGKQKQIDALYDYLQDADHITMVNTYNEYLALVSEQRAKLDMTNDFLLAVASYPRAIETINRSIAACGEGIVTVEVKSFTALNGNLSFLASGVDATKLNQFIESLEATGIFYNVTYSGYALAADNSYTVNVSCILDENAGR